MNVSSFALFTQVKMTMMMVRSPPPSHSPPCTHSFNLQKEKKFFWFNLPMPRTTYQRFSFGSAESFFRGVAVTPFTCDVISIFSQTSQSHNLCYYLTTPRKKKMLKNYAHSNYLLVVVQHFANANSLNRRLTD